MGIVLLGYQGYLSLDIGKFPKGGPIDHPSFLVVSSLFCVLLELVVQEMRIDEEVMARFSMVKSASSSERSVFLEVYHGNEQDGEDAENNSSGEQQNYCPWSA